MKRGTVRKVGDFGPQSGLGGQSHEREVNEVAHFFPTKLAGEADNVTCGDHG